MTVWLLKKIWKRQLVCTISWHLKKKSKANAMSNDSDLENITDLIFVQPSYGFIP